MKNSKSFYVFISPWLIGFFGLTLIPIGVSLYTSFTRWNGSGGEKFVGFANYHYMFTKDPLFYKSMFNTLYYAVGSVAAQVVIAIILAVLLNQKFRGRAFFRTVFFLPYVVTGIPVFVVWTWLFNPQFGTFNYALSLLGLPGLQWLNSQTLAMPSLILMSITSVGGMMVVFLAGLQGIPVELYDAAKIDGAGLWNQTIRVTIPMLSPVVLFNSVWGMIGALQVFAQPYAMTQGGPNYSTEVFALYLYQVAFKDLKFGYASGLAWVLFAVTLIVTLILFFALGRRGYEVD
ncbi:carbohydrate ABC transporter permease [Alicyclobacillus sp. SO9]|uniref:carbohydrate ABC transporter permease n=1 Tax=Alicyclobacillus sp. SO9 TaxID=2665646 RepID=UPI0018E7D420|nr:sugar ABC transporter permease [Alicyclobacillus sp. SO9]QQE77961.1 sugar ABC transporter permease [Alicyclobacillus sp. SO9]